MHTFRYHKQLVQLKRQPQIEQMEIENGEVSQVSITLTSGRHFSICLEIPVEDFFITIDWYTHLEKMMPWLILDFS